MFLDWWPDAGKQPNEFYSLPRSNLKNTIEIKQLLLDQLMLMDPTDPRIANIKKIIAEFDELIKDLNEI